MSYSNAIRGAAVLIGALIAAQSMAATPQEEQVMCRYDARPGSRIMEHTCLTETQWKERRLGGLNSPGVDAASPGGTTVSQQGPSQNWGGFQRY